MIEVEMNDENAKYFLGWLQGKNQDALFEQLTDQEAVCLFDDFAARGFYESSFFEQGERLAAALFKALGNGGSVLDIGSGSGHFIRHADIGSHYRGEELSHDEVVLSRTLIEKSGILNAEIVEVDALLNFSDRRYDQIFCNMPFIGRIDKRYYQALSKLSDYNIETRSLPDWLFAIRVVESLTEEGIGIAIMRLSSLNNIKDRAIRMKMIEKGYIHAVIELPDSLTRLSSAAMAMVVFRKRGEGAVTFVDGLHGREGKLTEEEIKRIVQAVTEKKGAIQRTIEEIRELDYTLRAYREPAEGVQLGRLATLFRGRDITKNELATDAEKEQKGYLLNLSELQDAYIAQPKQPLSQDMIDNRHQLLLQTDDILLTARGSSLKVAMVDERISHQQVIPSSNIMVIRCHSVNPYYVFAYLNSTAGRSRLNQLQTGSSLLVLSLKNMQAFTLPPEDIDVAEEMEETLRNYQQLMQQVEMHHQRLKSIYHV
ncbi:N-6 DNA methylase [Macrococcus brunensis]|uniref:N-6 DNA methylase n=1 Tax=Macrococcus brunensis TaxID=198483 RepID=UPI001EF0924E|nr:N-6 DNA methylase [Macrococcus brunensis]ULG71381.1 N-6 DNA methylase [Macrococcus brunensis]